MFWTESSPCWPPAGDSSKAFAAALQQSHLQDAWIGWVDTFSIFFCHCHIFIYFPLGPTFFFSTYGFQPFVFSVVDMLWSPDFRGWSWMTTKQRVCPSMLAYPSTTTQTSSHWLIPKAQMGDGCVCDFSNFREGTSFRWFSMELFI